MTDITHGTWIKDDTPVDKAFSNGGQFYGRNLYTDTKNFDNPSAWSNWGWWYKTGEKFNGLAVMQTTNDWNGLKIDAIYSYNEIKTKEKINGN